MFSASFFSVLVYGALIWCALSAVALAVLLWRDISSGNSW